jgi:hypothetical protein
MNFVIGLLRAPILYDVTRTLSPAFRAASAIASASSRLLQGCWRTTIVLRFLATATVRFGVDIFILLLVCAADALTIAAIIAGCKNYLDHMRKNIKDDMKATRSIPPPNAAYYKAGEYIYREGPKTENELIDAGVFGVPLKARENLRRSLEVGWLVSTGGVVTCCKSAQEHYASRFGTGPRSLPDQPKGQVVPPRFVDLLYGPPLSRKYIPNRRGPRIDAPDYSLAAIPSHWATKEAT